MSGAAALSLTDSQVLTALRAFLVDVLPAGVPVVRGQDNKVPEPAGGDFVVMTPVYRKRLTTNVDTDIDAVFIGDIDDVTMTVASVGYGTLGVGSPVFGVDVAAGTRVVSQDSGTPGGAGVYTVTPSQTVASEKLAAGVHAALQPTEVTVQLDIHGPASTDNAQVIGTLMRDDYACAFFAAQAYDVQPLYANDGRQVPFVNGEGQYEDRWIVEAVLQANPVISTPQQFADTLTIGLIDVDAVYPPEA